MILAGDIGGTNTRLAYFTDEGGRPSPHQIEVYPSGRFSDLHEIVSQFVAQDRQTITGACFGIAGPVVDGVCRTPNLPWVVESRNLATQLGLEHVRLINDLKANAYGIAALGDEDFAVLNKGEPDPQGNTALISAGTGLGQAGLYWDGDSHRPFASEGGHSDFAPRNTLEIALLTHYLQSHRHVSYEHVLSGPGLHNIYKFLVETGRGDEPAWLAKEMAERNPSAVITETAAKERAEVCTLAIDTFVSIYGAEAGNLALKVLATGGVFLGGGIAPKIIDKLRSPVFLESFTDKGRMKKLLGKIPVKVILNDKAALLGAARVALFDLE